MPSRAGRFGVPEVGSVELGGWLFPGVCIAIPHWRDNGKQFSMRRSHLMEPRNLIYMAQAAEGELAKGAPTTTVRRVCTDSRAVQAEDLFVALRGDRFDGHTFVGQVAQLGAAAAVVERDSPPGSDWSCGLITVGNSRLALGRIAARYRRDFGLPIVAVAGSNGKTTTKELIASVLRQKLQTHLSPASFNNDIGVPTTLLGLCRQHEVAVLEFGTNHPGELAPLLRMAQPKFGVIPSIGREHLEFFGDLDGVVEEEGSLAELLPSDGKLFLNADTLRAGDIARRSAAPVVLAGTGPGSVMEGIGRSHGRFGRPIRTAGAYPGVQHGISRRSAWSSSSCQCGPGHRRGRGIWPKSRRGAARAQRVCSSQNAVAALPDRRGGTAGRQLQRQC
jgi:hypothetical protein